MISVLLGAWTSTGHAEQCPGEQPQWLRGRVVVWESNLSPAQWKGLGEVFVYAYERGSSTPGTRYMAVSDAQGYFCIHETFAGKWVATVFEPFTFRPVVREMQCETNACDLGDVSVDTALRISDNYIDYNGSWYGYGFAQTVMMPEGSLSLVKASFRDGAASHPISLQLYEAESATGAVLAAAGLRVNKQANRDSAVFQPGEAQVAGKKRYTLVGRGGWAPWRNSKNVYADGQAFSVDGAGNLEALSGDDLALNLDIDGPDGNITSMFVNYNDGAQAGTAFVQSFVALSRSVTHASVFTGGGKGLRRMQAFVSATRDGPAIGPIKETKGLQQQGVAFAWFEDEVETVLGQTYYLHVRYPEPTGEYVLYTRKQVPRSDPNASSETEDDAYRAGSLWADGNQVSGDLWGRIMGPIPVSSTSDPTADSGTSPDASHGATPQSQSASANNGCSCQTSHGSTDWLGLLIVGIVPWFRRPIEKRGCAD